MPGSPRVLFVCTKFGGRSLLAAHLCNLRSPWGDIAVASGFEVGRLPSRYFPFIHSLGYDLPEQQSPSLFERYRKGEKFDVVVMMCNQGAGEQCQIFSLSVKELYGKNAQLVTWSIPDLSPVEAQSEQLLRDEVGHIIEELNAKIDQLLGDLRERFKSPLGATGPS